MKETCRDISIVQSTENVILDAKLRVTFSGDESGWF